MSLKDLGRELFSGSNDSKSAEELLRSDFKEFHISEQVLGVGQITCIDSQKLMERKEELLDAMRKVCRTHSYDMVILMLTDVLQEGSQLLYIGSDDTIRNAFAVEPKDNTVFLPGVMSRKKVPNRTSQSLRPCAGGTVFHKKYPTAGRGIFFVKNRCVPPRPVVYCA
ncbi:MAG: hypothetical protein BHW35_02445 [Firmicutes bacterium CAG:176_63_11]|nr:MAG: hypothetical protein BHW35_02445 [Firmicutes bacterium CAG:176_63_11]